MGVGIISFERDKAAAAAMQRHHTAMVAELSQRVEDLVAAVSGTATGTIPSATAETARAAVTVWCEQELLPHHQAIEKALYPVGFADPRGSLLVEGMLAEHELVRGLVDEVRTADDLVVATASATAAFRVFAGNVTKTDELLLPLLASSPHVSLADLVDGLHELVGEERQTWRRRLVSR